jgi:hypothetical protein
VEVRSHLIQIYKSTNISKTCNFMNTLNKIVFDVCLLLILEYNTKGCINLKFSVYTVPFVVIKVTA